MYEPHTQAMLQRILNTISDEFNDCTSQIFLSRLGANFYSMHALFQKLYGDRPDAEAKLTELITALARSYQQRPAELYEKDVQREQNPDWFLSQNWVGMALYCDRFADGLAGVNERIDYLDELGVNMVHIMPMMQAPAGANDGGYAISDFRQVDSRFGTLSDVTALSDTLRNREMLLTLDVVINHSSNEHQWARKAREGDPKYRDYYYLYPDRQVPDQFEQTLPEIFPETAPGSFTWDDELQNWVMTVFNNYQWDLNYRNPDVFREMIEIILFWANQGADILRLDAPAFIWKQLGTNCQNLPEAHLILQLFKDCTQVVCPGVLFIAEAIVAPKEIIKYFGPDPLAGRECEIAYNATFMALLWDAVATRNSKVLNQALHSLPAKPERTTWLNYVRCHDDIGLGFEDADIAAAGLTPYDHRRYLMQYLTGQHINSSSRGLAFATNEKTGDARISGSLASLAGLEKATVEQDSHATKLALRRILTLHALTMAYGGITLLYYSDELATLNDYSYEHEPEKAPDNRWVHRPKIDWQRAEQRHIEGTKEQHIFSGLQQLIALRKRTEVFADFNNRQLLGNDNQHLFSFARYDPSGKQAPVVVIANFDERDHFLNLDNLRAQGYLHGSVIYDLKNGEQLALPEPHLLSIPACGFYYLTNQISTS
jgi:amylosucrase